MNASSSRSQSSGKDELSWAWDKLHRETSKSVEVFGAFTAFAVAIYPFIVMKHRLLDQQSVGQGVRDLIREERWRVFYRRSVHVYGCMFAYETSLILANEYLKRSRAKEE